ncbi:FMN-binding protein MioC [Ferrimonas aestuarii]|uniref:FMN-binding protein MioC n=1 Tax=Ferrimonas aestuarii TaxID=2569539 RepID=A0A4V5NVU0_9GAMM|nr:FMN-binding protein MioC [Ferrimonas aestuarii]TKB51889.1 FMN-binding protein MioC [Ferrimonas aestuarii]
MTTTAVIVGTTLGNAEAVSDELIELLNDNGIDTEQYLEPELNQVIEHQNWLVVTSTHGAGELPDNLHKLFSELETADLSSIRFAICGIGDSSYDTFCQAASLLDHRLTQQGATALVNKIEIDVQAVDLPEDQALEWIQPLISLLKS